MQFLEEENNQNVSVRILHILPIIIGVIMGLRNGRSFYGSFYEKNLLCAFMWGIGSGISYTFFTTIFGYSIVGITSIIKTIVNASRGSQSDIDIIQQTVDTLLNNPILQERIQNSPAYYALNEYDRREMKNLQEHNALSVKKKCAESAEMNRRMYASIYSPSAYFYKYC